MEGRKIIGFVLGEGGNKVVWEVGVKDIGCNVYNCVGVKYVIDFYFGVIIENQVIKLQFCFVEFFCRVVLQFYFFVGIFEVGVVGVGFEVVLFVNDGVVQVVVVVFVVVILEDNIVDFFVYFIVGVEGSSIV